MSRQPHTLRQHQQPTCLAHTLRHNTSNIVSEVAVAQQGQDNDISTWKLPRIMKQPHRQNPTAWSKSWWHETPSGRGPSYSFQGPRKEQFFARSCVRHENRRDSRSENIWLLWLHENMATIKLHLMSPCSTGTPNHVKSRLLALPGIWNAQSCEFPLRNFFFKQMQIPKQ